MNFDQRNILFGCWIGEVDQLVEVRYGCSVHEMVEVPLLDWFVTGHTPEEAATLCKEFAV